MLLETECKFIQKNRIGNTQSIFFRKLFQKKIRSVIAGKEQGCLSKRRCKVNISLKTSKMKSQGINSDRAPQAVGLYPHARRVGNLLFLSGVGPRQKGNKSIPGVELNEKGEIISYDIAMQCHSVFQNIRYILEDAGSSWENLLDVTVFLTNMKDDFPTYNKLYAEYFGDAQPCRTTVEINALPTPIAIELKVIAWID
jgi:2-aminomuconate deaminase